MALSLLGESELIIDSIYEALRISVDAVLVQGGRQSAYGHTIMPNVEEANAEKSESTLSINVGPYTKNTITKPSACPSCGKASKDTMIKNLGFRFYKVQQKSESKVGESQSELEDMDRNITIRHRYWECKSCRHQFVGEQV